MKRSWFVMFCLMLGAPPHMAWAQERFWPTLPSASGDRPQALTDARLSFEPVGELDAEGQALRVTAPWAPVVLPSTFKQLIVLPSAERVPVYSEGTTRVVQAVRLIDERGAVYATEAGGLLDATRFEMSLSKGKGHFDGWVLQTSGFDPVWAHAEGPTVQVRDRVSGLTGARDLAMDFTLPAGFSLILNAPTARSASAGPQGAAGSDGRSGSRGCSGACDGGNGGHGERGANGGPGEDGRAGDDAAEVQLVVRSVAARFHDKGLWRYDWRQGQRAGSLLTHPAAPLTVLAQGADGARGGAGGGGGAGGRGGDGGDGGQGDRGKAGRNGRAGASGARGADATSTWMGSNGDNGGPGTDGTDGGRGGRGGDGGRGGNGGDGAIGGKGGNGGNGGRGARVVVMAEGDLTLSQQVRAALNISVRGGRPGEPGRGGAAGVAGLAGAGGSGGEGGDGGPGGQGGPGGRGGAGGRSYSGTNYVNGIAVPVFWAGGIDGWQGPSGDDGRQGPRGPQGSDGAPGAAGRVGVAGAAGAPGLNGPDGVIVYSDQGALEAERARRARADQQLDKARQGGSAKDLARAALDKADSQAPDKNVDGSWSAVDKTLSDGLKAGGEDTDVSDLERMLRKQIEAKKNK